MNKKCFYFGEEVEGYNVRVLNEREVRAAAGILFFFSMITFLNAMLINNFFPTKVFIIIFLVDFFIRLFINPKYSPVMILARFIVSNQKVEYTGAPQKKFAWAIGFVLALIMSILIIFNNTMTPIICLICLVCIIFLLFESCFGICIGCQIYNFFSKEKAELCPGGTCETFKKEEIQKIHSKEIIILVLCIAFIFFLSNCSLLKGSGMGYQNGNNFNNFQNSTGSNCQIQNLIDSIRHGGCNK